MPTKVGATLSVDGAGAFRQAMSNANASVKTLDAEMQKLTASFAGNKKSMESLTQQNDVLQRRSDELNKKLDIQKERLQKLSDAGVDPASASYQKLQADIYKTEAELAKNDQAIKENTERLANNGMTAKEAGEAQKKAAEEASKAQAKAAQDAAAAEKKAAEEAEKAHERHMKAVKNVTSALAAMAAAALSAVGAIGKMVIDVGQEADELNTLSKQTGLSTEELQRFQYASELIDVSMETLTGSMTKLTRNMASAKSGTGETAKAFESLGVSVTDSSGELRDRNEVFNETITALGKVENATERDALAMQIFGRSAQELNPLILGGADALQELGDQAQAAGIILDQKTLDGLNDVSDAVDKLKSTATGAKRLLLAGFAQPVSGAIDQLTGYMERLTKAFSESGFEGLTDEFGRVLEDGLSYISNNIGKVTEMGTKIIKTLAEALITALPDLASAGVEMVTTLVDSIANDLPQLVPLAAQVVGDLVVNLINAAPKLISSGLTLITKLAEGVVQAIPKLVAKVPEIISGIVGSESGGGLLGAIPDIIEAGVTLLGTLANNIDGIVSSVVLMLPEIITGIIGDREKGTGLLGNIPKIIDAGIKLFQALVDNVGNIVLAIVGSLPALVEGLTNTENGLLSPENIKEMLRAGIQLFLGILSDIPQIVKSLADLLWEFVTQFAEALANLGYILWEVGKKWAKRMWEGFIDNWKKLFGSFDTTEELNSNLLIGGDQEIAEAVAKKTGTNLGSASQPVITDSMSQKEIEDVINNAMMANAGAGGSAGRSGTVQTNVYIDKDKVAEYITPAIVDAAAASGRPFATRGLAY